MEEGREEISILWLCQGTGGLSNVVSENIVCTKLSLNLPILQLEGLDSIESEIDVRKFLLHGRLLTECKMDFVPKSRFQSRATSYFDPNIK